MDQAAKEDEFLSMQLIQSNTNDGIISGSSNRSVVSRLLRENLRAGDIRAFTSLLEQSCKSKDLSFDINEVHENEETFLDTASRLGYYDIVKLLLEQGASPNRINRAHNRAPLHFAAEAGHIGVLQVLLSYPTTNPNLQIGGQTALHLAVKNKNVQCMTVLLENGASPNIPNSKGITAIHAAAVKGLENMVSLICQKTKHQLDLDNFKDYTGKTTRDILQVKLPELAQTLPEPRERPVNIHDLRYYLSANDEENFLRNAVKLDPEDLQEESAEDLLVLATERNLRQAVDFLLKALAKKENTGNRKILLFSAQAAISRGYSHLLTEFFRLDPSIAWNFLIDACIELGSDDSASRLECLRIILDYNVDVRVSDGKGNTPLHYAARSGNMTAVKWLLQKGSYIGHKNHFQQPPISDIPSEILSEFLDGCLTKKKDGPNEYSIEFDYQCLIPEPRNHKEVNEMETLEYIADKEGLKHLLKHPLLSSFLYLKWRRVRHLLYVNFIFYLFFYLTLNSYVLFTTYQTERSNNFTLNDAKEFDKSDAIEWTLRMLTSLGLLLLIIREMIQFVLAPLRYMTSFENWLEITLIVLATLMLINDLSTRNQIGAVVILLSAWELVLLIGQHPRMSTGIQLFKTVTENFIRFLFLYAFLILAFALAFFTLFKNSDNDHFPDPGRSLFKTIIMLTGEFDAGDIPFVSQPILSHFIFILFVFMITIVLFNLLNGMAVSDTADILGKAELVGLVARTRLVSYIEYVSLGNSHWLPFNSSNRFDPRFSSKKRWNPVKSFARRILLFPDHLENGKIIIKPLEGYETYQSHDCDSGGCFGTMGRCCVHCLDMKMEPSIMERVKEILSDDRTLNEKKFCTQLAKINEHLASIDQVLNILKHTLYDKSLIVTDN
ncbi:transient receptor potential cation channel protein painless isoform X2 [Prorops nasuta]